MNRITAHTRYLLVGPMHSALRQAARMDLALREWAHVEQPGELRVFEKVGDVVDGQGAEEV